MPGWTFLRRLAKPLLLGALFVTQLLGAVTIHLDTALARRCIEHWISGYLSTELRGTLDIGQIERLTTSTVWLKNVIIYDEQQRRVATLARVRAHSTLAGAIYRWFRKREALTIVVESVRADGVHLRLHPDPFSERPSLLSALEGSGKLGLSSADKSTGPYRVSFPHVEIGDVALDSTLPSFMASAIRLRQLSGQLLFTDRGMAISLSRFSLDMSDPIAAPLHAFGALEYRSPDRLWGNVQADVADTAFTARFDYRNGQLESSAYVPEIHPLRIGKWVKNWPLRLPVAATLRTHGPVENLATRLELTAGSNHLESVGAIHLGSRTHAEFVINGQSLDLESLFGVELPTQLSVAAKVTAELDEGTPRLHFDGVLYPGHVAQIATPQVDFQGDYDPEGLMLSGRSSDRELPIRAALTIRDKVMHVDAQCDGVGIGSLVPKAWKLPSTGRLTMRARAQIADGNVSANLHATLRNATLGATRLASFTTTTNVAGPVTDPAAWSGDLIADVRELVSPYVRIARTSATVEGNRRRAHLRILAEEPNIAKLLAEADLHIAEGYALRGVRLELTRGITALALRVSEVSVSNDTLNIDGLVVEGSAGRLAGSLGIGRNHIVGKIAGDAIDLGVVSDLVSLPNRLISGRANLAIDVDSRQASARGRAHIDLDRVAVGPVTNLTGAIDADLTDREVVVTAALSSDLIDSARAHVQATLGGPASHWASYRDAIGRADLNLTKFRLDRLGTLLGVLKDGLILAGTADLNVGVERPLDTVPPNLTATLVTHQMGLVIPTSTSQIRLEGIDLQCGSTWLGNSGALQSDWVLTRHDAPKATLHLTATLPSEGSWDAQVESLKSKWQTAPFELLLTIPRQALAESSQISGTILGSGEVEVKLWLKGPIQELKLVSEVRGNQLLLAPIGNSIAFDMQAMLEYAHASGEARLLWAAGSGEKTWTQVNAVGHLLPCSAGFGCVRDWEGSIEAGLLGLPLQALPMLGPLGFSGDLRGVVSARRQDGTTSIDGVLPVDAFRVSGHPLGQTLLHLRSDRESLIAGAKLMDGSAHIDFEAHVPTLWRHVLPSRREDLPIHFAAQASGYDAAILAPWIDEYATELEGELDGSVEATYGVSPQTAKSGQPRLAMGGRVGLKNGGAKIRALGLKLQDLSLDAQATSSETRSTIAISRLSASIDDGAGRVAGSALVELDGLKLKRIAAQIDEAKNVPLIANATTLATLNANASLEMVPKPNGYDVDLGFKSLEVHLPRSSARQIVGLSENPDVVVIQPLGSAAWRRLRSPDKTEYRIRLALGNKAEVSRNDFTLPISGTPEITVTERVRPSGSIQLEPMGRLQLFGKVFVIDHGSLSFDPDQPSNPRLDVTATWRGPTHSVTVRIQGKSDEARLRLSSDPALASEAQVMALLLGGGGGNDSTTTAGLGVGATLFNEVLSDTALSNLELRTSTDGRRANYTAAMPLRENLWFEATYQSPSNSNLPGSSSQHGFSGTVDYRFRRNWSVRTEVGTLGAGADLLWQYRY